MIDLKKQIKYERTEETNFNRLKSMVDKTTTLQKKYKKRQEDQKDLKEHKLE